MPRSVEGVDNFVRRTNDGVMKRVAPLLLATLLLATPVQVAAAPDENDAKAKLTATFIGNEAFAITDGIVTLVTDFPYQSGYSLYMEYDPAALEIEGEVLALVTHRHLDHFDPTLFLAKDWWVVAPREITDGLSKSRVIPMADQVEYLGIRIEPIRTKHSTTEHFSYLVIWQGRKLYFFGDTESAGEFLALGKEVDLVFMPPWVLRPLLLDGIDIPAKQIVIYHQRVGEPLPRCGKSRALAQGESFILD